MKWVIESNDYTNITFWAMKDNGLEAPYTSLSSERRLFSDYHHAYPVLQVYLERHPQFCWSIKPTEKWRTVDL